MHLWYNLRQSITEPFVSFNRYHRFLGITSYSFEEKTFLTYFPFQRNQLSIQFLGALPDLCINDGIKLLSELVVVNRRKGQNKKYSSIPFQYIKMFFVV